MGGVHFDVFAFDLYLRSGKRVFEYQSYDDYIVAFEQRYLNAKELCNPAALAAKFRQILEAGMEEGDNKDDKLMKPTFLVCMWFP